MISFSLPEIIEWVKDNPDKVILCEDQSGEVVIATGLSVTKDDNNVPKLIFVADE